jgi:pimeloyl-ACP methyl ester carboxylesterase
MTESRFISHNGSRLHYIKAGTGKQTLLFFHGFGQDHTVYLPLVQTLAKNYSLYIFDLFFHGQSTWAHNERTLEKAEWKTILGLFLQTHSIDSFSLVGYSMGGKFALATVESFPDLIQKVFLIAPDGVKTSFWYSMATYPFFLRKFFKSMITNYQRFEKLAMTLAKLKLADNGLIRFADYQMGTEEKRKRVYYSWVVFRHITFDIKRIASILNTNKIPMVIIVGQYDNVIRPENMKRFLSIVNDAKLEIVDSGHSGLIYKSIPFIMKSR